MKLFYANEHVSCMNYKTKRYDGFFLGVAEKGDQLNNQEQAVKANQLIFIIEGEVSILRDNQCEKTVRSGEFLFIPISSSYVGTVIESGRYLCLTFFSHNISLCDKHMLESYLDEVSNIDPCFDSLPIREPLDLFIHLMEVYLNAGVNCKHLHEIKEKELFLILRTAYTKTEITKLFHPIIGVRADFKESVLMHSEHTTSRKELAHLLMMSESNLVRKFREEFGETVYSWLLKQKNRRISTMLSYPATTIKEVVDEFNFSSAASFNKYCKSNFGCNPTELKDRIRCNNTGDYLPEEVDAKE